MPSSRLPELIARRGNVAEYPENKLPALYSEANAAFLNENFKRAEELTEQILAEDPGNPAATSLRGVARDMRHAKVDEQNRRSRCVKEESEQTYTLKRMPSGWLVDSVALSGTTRRTDC